MAVVPIRILDSLEARPDDSSPLIRVAYLVNQYPKVSHSFIRREIQALERQGVEVLRIALRGWDAEVADAEDARERERTRYVLQDGIVPLAAASLGTMVTAPVRFARALGLAMRMARRSHRPLPYHLAYLAEACRLLPWLRGYGATHVHAHFGTNAAEIAMLTGVLGGPGYSFTVHGPEEFDTPEALELGEKVRRARFVVAISSYGRAQLMRWSAHADWPKINVVHCGVDAAFYSVPAAPLPEAPRCVCVGRLCEQKGQVLLVEAVARLATRGVACELVFAGDGEMRRDVEAAIARHHLESSVWITGWIDGERVRREILAARLLVLPSFAEGLPVVIMEALALRRPVITTYVAGIPELVRHGENGWLVPAGDVAALAGALEEAISESPLTLARMGEAGRTRVLERHAIDTEVAKLAEHFLAAAGSDAASRALKGATA
jgi:glycosyltransferase involved in cell wall biosynthesis